MQEQETLTQAAEQAAPEEKGAQEQETVTGTAPQEAQTEAAAQEEKEPEPAPETMADYADELEASFRQIHEGDMLTGTVISVDEEQAQVDLGYYTDGIIRAQDASDDPTFSLKEHLEPGTAVSATVLARDDGAGHILLSLKEAAALQAWDRLRELNRTQENVTVKITDVTKSGVIAYLEGVRGFIPASKLALTYVEESDLPSYVGKSMDVRVITADEADHHLVMSAKDILREKAQEERARKISNVQVGLVTEGTVETIKPYGAFINLGDGLSGLLHISQISQRRLKTPNEVLKEGQTVKVKIIANKDGKLSLSMKALEDAKPEKIEEETYELPKTEELTTSLGSLFKNIKL